MELRKEYEKYLRKHKHNFNIDIDDYGEDIYYSIFQGNLICYIMLEITDDVCEGHQAYIRTSLDSFILFMN